MEERQTGNDVIYRLDTTGTILQSQQLILPDTKIKYSTALYLGIYFRLYTVNSKVIYEVQ